VSPRSPIVVAFAGIVALCLTATRPHDAAAQVRGSERSRISQISDGTTVTIDYARPQVRGRAPVFPELIEWGHVWTPGANSATTFETDQDVELNGVAVPAGRYSVWMVPEEGAWDFFLDPDDRLYHTQPPKSRPEQIRFSVVPQTTSFTEVLTWEFPGVAPAGMDLRFRWDETSIDFHIDVEPTAVASVPAEEARMIEGEYTVRFPGPPPPGAPPEAMPPVLEVSIWYEGGRLLGTMGMQGEELDEFEILRAADFVFNPGWMMDGEVFETELEMFFEFALENGVVSGFDVRGVVDDRIDRLMMTGERTR